MNKYFNIISIHQGIIIVSSVRILKYRILKINDHINNKFIY